MSPRTFYSLVAILSIAGGTALLWYLLGSHAEVEWVLVPYLVVTNIVAFAYYGHDKLMARHKGRRVPELVLHGLAVVGGSLGALAGMRLFRHKTVKGRFRGVFWAILVAQVVIVAVLFARLRE
jgi:uncharacterized membrane protein YsdA (DUF1294 family)